MSAYQNLTLLSIEKVFPQSLQITCVGHHTRALEKLRAHLPRIGKLIRQPYRFIHLPDIIVRLLLDSITAAAGCR